MPRQSIACVVCQQPMTKMTVAGDVQIDCCDEHGVWLDRNELEAITRHAQQKSAPARPGMLQNAGQTLVQGAASAAGWNLGRELSSSLIRRLFG